MARGCAAAAGEITIRPWFSSHPRRPCSACSACIGPDMSSPAAASLAGTSRGQARAAMDELVRANLLTEHRSGRYAGHDLLHAYAAELARAIDGDERRNRLRLHSPR
ncbi:MAG TPA: hypothetical protein VG268_17125 [Streptosporangiaceae bacterium]|nr:hypothetical protein [Streptosporangiaceae bacterium]